MSLDALIAELTRTAEAEAARIRADAAGRADAIRRTGEAEIERRRAAEGARLEELERRAVARETAAAARANRLAVLQARGGVLAEVFARAEATLAAAEATRYRDGIPALVGATVPYLEGVPSVLRCRPDVIAAVRAACDGAVATEVVAAADAEAGLLGESRDGTLVVDNRLRALLARRRDELSVALARRLEES